MAMLIFSVLVLAGLGFLIFSGSKKEEIPSTSNDTASEDESSSNQEAPKDFNEKTTLAKLMDKGGNYQCTFSHMTEVGTSTGTVFISDKKIRGDFVSKVSIAGLGDMGNIQTFMISDGESVYTWSSMSSDGYKTKVTSQNTTSQSDASVPTNQELDYTCVGWNVDESKFALPTNITFKTL